jgi:NADH-quinone oxidoreductase subunit E
LETNSKPVVPPAPLVAFSKEAEAEIRAIEEKYPDPPMRLLPALHVAQRSFGWISSDVMRLVAERLSISLARVESVVTFYTMLHQRPVGKYHVQVCMSLPCALRGSGEIYAAFRKRLGIGPGAITDDGLFSLAKAECLAQCDHAPMAQVNERDHLDLTEERVAALLEEYQRRGGAEAPRRVDSKR